MNKNKKAYPGAARTELALVAKTVQDLQEYGHAAVSAKELADCDCRIGVILEGALLLWRPLRVSFNLSGLQIELAAGPARSL